MKYEELASMLSDDARALADAVQTALGKEMMAEL